MFLSDCCLSSVGVSTNSAGPSPAKASVDAITAGPDTSKPVPDNAAAGFFFLSISNLIVLPAAVTDPADTLQTDTTAPVVTSVVTSGAGIDGGGNGDLNAGRVVTLTVSMSEAVTVGGGTPTLSLNNGGTAHYTGGSGTDALTFGYAVGAGQDTADLMVTSLNLNGATLRDVANNGANLSGAAINPAGTLQIDTTAPPVPTITSTVPGGVGGNHCVITGIRRAKQQCRNIRWSYPAKHGDGFSLRLVELHHHRVGNKR